MSSADPEEHREVKEIFYAALQLAPDERERFLDEACKGDEHVRRAVVSLLSSSEAAGSFMREPAVAEVAAEIVAERSKKFRKGQTVGHYKILKELGAGGQGAVYQALDLRLNRTVALKMLPPELTVDEISRKRFRREAQLASALDHPNICTIYDLTEIDGTHFIFMQFVAGRTVRELVGGRPLELETALRIAIQVCDALAAAHAEGIIHRDIKAHNIIVTDKGQAKILDFGLAKLARERADGAEQTELTALGSPYGTPTYAAPEQSRGERVDHRADIFSTGVLLYEMLSGTWAFHGKTAVDVRHAVLHDEPQPVAERRGEPIPEKLQEVVSRALTKQPGERFQEIAEMRDELIEVLRGLPGGETSDTARFLENFKPFAPRRIGTLSNRAILLLASAALLVLIFAGLLFYRPTNTRQAKTPPTPIESIAVLPFVNESGSADAEYLSDGVTETLIGSLSQLPNLSVKARSSVFRYKGKDTDAQTIGRELNVQAILTGRVVQRGDDLTLFLSLVDAANGNNLWSRQYNRKLTNLVALQNDIARDVADSLEAKLSGADEQKLAKSYTKNTEAYQLYLKGRYHWYKSTPEDSSKAREYFRQAIDVDPAFALAYSGLADFYGRASALGQMRPEEGWPKHEAAARKALELDPNIAEVHNSLAGLRLYYYRDVPGAESEFKRAIELDPNYVEARAHYGGYLTLVGRFDEAVAQSKRAQELDPLSPGISRRFGRTLFHARRYDEAIQQFLKALELNPGSALAHEDLGDAYEQKKMYGEAVAAWHRAMTLSRNDELAATLDRAYKESGYEGAVRAASRKRLEQLGEKARRGEFVPAMDFVRLYVRLGDKEQTFAWLEKAYEERTRFIFIIKVDSLFDGLRADPRFADLLRRLNLQ